MKNNAKVRHVEVLLQYISIPKYDKTRLDLLNLFLKLIITKKGITIN